jgi:hypothetical protein
MPRASTRAAKPVASTSMAKVLGSRVPERSNVVFSADKKPRSPWASRLAVAKAPSNATSLENPAARVLNAFALGS